MNYTLNLTQEMIATIGKGLGQMQAIEATTTINELNNQVHEQNVARQIEIRDAEEAKIQKRIDQALKEQAEEYDREAKEIAENTENLEK